jgi:tRNA dimethylallyltransferase
MLKQGLMNELRGLRKKYPLHPNMTSMRCVGYRQAWEYLDAHEARGLDAHEAGGLAGHPPLAELRDKGIFATRQLAKRQITWLRSMPQRRVVACDDPAALQQVLTIAQVFAAGRS